MDEALSSISPTVRGQLERMLITGIFGSNCDRLIYLNSVRPLVCKKVTSLLGEFKS